MLVNLFLIQMINLIIYLHNCGLVATSITIVWCREHSYYCSVVLPLIPLHNQLMRPGNEVQVVDVGKLLGDVLTKSVARSAGGNTPLGDILM